MTSLPHNRSIADDYCTDHRIRTGSAGSPPGQAQSSSHVGAAGIAGRIPSMHGLPGGLFRIPLRSGGTDTHQLDPFAIGVQDFDGNPIHLNLLTARRHVPQMLDHEP